MDFYNHRSFFNITNIGTLENPLKKISAEFLFVSDYSEALFSYSSRYPIFSSGLGIPWLNCLFYLEICSQSLSKFWQLINFLNSIYPHRYLYIYQEPFNNLILLIFFLFVIHGKDFATISCMAGKAKNGKASGMDMKKNTDINQRLIPPALRHIRLISLHKEAFLNFRIWGWAKWIVPK